MRCYERDVTTVEKERTILASGSNTIVLKKSIQIIFIIKFCLKVLIYLKGSRVMGEVM